MDDVSKTSVILWPDEEVPSKRPDVSFLGIDFNPELLVNQFDWREKSYEDFINKNGVPRLTPWMITGRRIPLSTHEGLYKLWKSYETHFPQFLVFDLGRREIDISLRRIGFGTMDGRVAIKARRLGISIAVTYDSENGYRHWKEKQVSGLIQELLAAEIVVGANLVNFDYLVLERYQSNLTEQLAYKTIDILAQAKRGLFFGWFNSQLESQELEPTIKNIRRIWRELFKSREIPRPPDALVVPPSSQVLRKALNTKLTLDRIAEGTLALKKTRKSRTAPDMFARRRYKQLAEYCAHDVKLTKGIFEFGLKNRYLNAFGYRIPVRFGQLLRRLPFQSPKKYRYEDRYLEFEENLMSRMPSCKLERQFMEWRQQEGLSLEMRHFEGNGLASLNKNDSGNQ